MIVNSLFDHIWNGINRMQEMGVNKDDIKILISGLNIKHMVYGVRDTTGIIPIQCDNNYNYVYVFGLKIPYNGNYPLNDEIILFTDKTTYYPELIYRINLTT